jgi:O-acetyl-ADP-ribose deacetylase (regulator of RNase III)
VEELKMRWQVHHGDILDVSADVLVCSANVYLSLSGGVGGAFLRRYGDAMLNELQRYLRDRGIRHVEQGDVVSTGPCGSPYRTVLHAVAVDAFYESSPINVAAVLGECLRRAASLSARSVAVPALATGTGRLTMADFAVAVASIIEQHFPPIARVVIGVRSQADAEELQSLLPQLQA